MTVTTRPDSPPSAGEHLGHETVPFGERYRRALGSERLSGNLTRFQQGWRQSRGDIMAEVEFESLRARLKTSKTRVTDDLDRYLDQFQAAAEEAGATVHRAATAADANRIAREIAEARGVTLVAKSKSMVTEETELNHDFGEAGIEVVETDLGEWIVQLRHERPSHMVMPAVHLSRQEVGDIFTRALGREISRDDIGEQVRVARDEIRKVFFAAGMGITGANALIAESGTVMMVTNEGNGRLTASMPPVHVVFAGIEKLVPTYDDAMVQLRLLGRSGTAQRITSYSTFITGPTPGHEMHIVLVDNGRREMAARPEFVEALHCIRCAACANVCPPYREVGGHVFGHIYSGAIGLVVTPFVHGIDAAAGPQSLCLSCNACETVCPVGIPLPRQILDVRRMVAEKKGLKVAKRAILGVYARPQAADLVFRIGQRAQLPATRGGRFVRMRSAPVLRNQTRWRSMPALARQPLRDQVRRGVVEPGHRPAVANSAAGLTVALFPGCMTDRLYPEQGSAIRSSLLALGVNVLVPNELNCCGLPANNSGDAPHAVMMARQTISALERARADYIVSGSASCVATLTQDYEHLFRNEPGGLARARAVGAKVRDFTSFMAEVARIEPGALDDGSGAVVAYHDSCQGLNALGLRAEPRTILAGGCGFEVRDLKESLCCGFGGSFSFEYPAIAERLMDRKLDDAEETGAHVLVTDNQGCIMHLRGGCDAQGRPLVVRHIAELVAERLLARERAGG
ncbi:MAG: LUD domain-containing protein [Chloroflexota bacterium]